MKVTYYGHSCFSVEAGGKKMLFDPFIKPNEKAKHVDFNSIEADVILVSHAHYDHLADAVELAQKTQALVIANHEVSLWLEKQGVKNVMGMNIGGNKRFEFANIKLVHAVHSSSFPDGSYGGLAGGFIVETPDGNFYYSGDTALSRDFEMIGEWYELDLAILPIGDFYTMGTEDAIVCADFVQCPRVMGVHYDTFEAISINKDEAREQFKLAGFELLLPDIGGSIEIDA